MKGQAPTISSAASKTEAWLQLVSEQMPAVYWTTDADLRLTSTHGAGLRIPRYEVTGASLYDFFRSDDTDFPTIAAHLSALEGESARFVQNWKGRVYDGRVKPFLNEQGETVGCVGVAFDITKDKESQQALLESEQRFQILAKSSPSIVYQIDADGTPVYVNDDRWNDLTGLPPGSWTGRGWTAAIHPKDRRRVYEHWTHTAARGERYRDEYRFQRPDGSVIWVLSLGEPIRGDDGSVTGYIGTCADISPIRKVVDALGESEERYRSLVEGAPICMHEIDLGGKLTAVNPAGFRMMGDVAESSVIGRDYLKVIRQKDNQEIAAHLARAYQGESAQFEFTVTIGNDPRNYVSSLVPIFGSGGAVRKLMGTTEDITERTRAQASLKNYNEMLEERVVARTAELAAANDSIEQSTARLQAVFRAYPDLQFRLLMDGTILDHRAGQLGDLYVPPDSFLGKRMQDVLPSDVGEQFEKAIEEVQKNCTLVSIEYSLPVSKGERTFEARLVPLEHDQIFVIARDITDRRRLDAILRASEEKHRNIVETASEGIWVIDEQARITFANNRIAEMLACSPEEMVGSHIFDYMDTQGRVLATDFLGRRRQGLDGRHDFCFQRKDGQPLWTILSARPNFNAEGLYTGGLLMVTDITDRKLAEEALGRNKHLLAVGTLAAGISHEINNPLSALMIAAKIARNSADDPNAEELLRESLDLIRSESERIRDIVKNVQNYARQGVLKKSSCNLADLVHNACSRTCEYAEENGIPLTLDLPEQLPSISVNAVEIEQVIINLVRNAVEATEGTNPITIRVSQSTDAIEIAVQDRGRGMDEDELNRIFDPFFSTRENAGGTGLGLSIAHSIVIQHGGILDFQSEPGVGTEATVIIPMSPPGNGHQTS